MEEVHAEKMMSELIRVTRPGGRVGVIVRALDLPRWSSLPLDPDLKARVETWPDTAEGEGCARARLYGLMADAGIEDLQCLPDITPFSDPNGAVEQLLVMMMTADMDAEEKRDFENARSKAVSDGTFSVSWPHHCAVGTVP